MLTALDKLPNDALIRLPAVQTVVPYCKSLIYRKIELKEFPAPVKLGRRASGWRMGDIRAWLRDPTGWDPLRRRSIMALIPGIAVAIDVTGLFDGPCTYFIYKDDELLYIGRSAVLWGRLLQHKHSGKDFTKVLALPCPEEMLPAVEKVLIYNHKPQLNRRFMQPTAEELEIYDAFMSGSTPPASKRVSSTSQQAA